jgi:hypothetical protein
MEKAPVRLSPEHQVVLCLCLAMSVSLVRKGSVIGFSLGMAPWSLESSRGLRTVWKSPQEACFPGPLIAYHPKERYFPDLYNHLSRMTKPMDEPAHIKRQPPSILTRMAPALFFVFGIIALGTSLVGFSQGNGSLWAVVIEPAAMFAVAWEAQSQCRRYDDENSRNP